MPRITLETKKKVGSVFKIYLETFEIPMSILHHEDNKVMWWSSYNQSYECSCGHIISGKDYVISQITQSITEDEEEQEM